MKTFSKLFFALLAISGTAQASTYCDKSQDYDYEDSCASSCRGQNHNVQFQLFDAYGWPVENTEFWTTIRLHKEGSRITLSLPAINFQTGQYSSANPERGTFSSLDYTVLEGGTLRAINGFLPKAYRPTDPMYRSFIVPSNNGQSLAFSYTTTFSELPLPPTGYMLSINYSGQLIIQGVGTFNNNIAPGFQVMAPTDVSYFHERTKKQCENVTISSGASNITTFTFPANSSGYRDTQVNDAFNRRVCCSWVDNSNIDQSQNTLNVMVSVGTVQDGTLAMGLPVQLTNLPPGVTSADTAVAIDRISSDTIVVSYAVLDNVNANPSPLGFGFTNWPCRAVSFDGGQTWPQVFGYDAIYGSMTITTATQGILYVSRVYNGSLTPGQVIVPNYLATGGYAPNTVILSQLTGTPGGVGTYAVSNPQTIPADTFMVASWPLNGPIPINGQASGGFGDNRGVAADKYGNIWYSTTNTWYYNQPTFWMSSDGGVTWGDAPAFIMEPFFIEPDLFGWDYPQYCFGQDGSGNYGLWAVADYYADPFGITIINSVGFIPISGDTVGTGSNVFLPAFDNSIQISNPAAADDGRVWLYGYNNYPVTYLPKTLLFKSPGALDANYAGAWQNALTNGYQFINGSFGSAPLIYSSFPGAGYFDSAKTILFDEKRQALYTVIAQNAPDFSQNMTLYLLISRNNGQTWSEPFEISSTIFANRGFQSMALDTVTGDLVFTWYDGRNDVTETTVEFFGTAIPSKKLDRMVKNIPLSNPTYLTGSAE